MKLDASAIATLGASLRPINPSLMKAGEEGDAKQRLWYQGCEPYFDVTIEKQGADITWVQVTLRGRVVSWRPPNYLQTGETDEMDVPPEVAYYAASKTIRDGAAIDWLLVASIQAILAQRPEEPMLTQVSNLLANCLNEHPSHA
jgi:hypothetical protein